MGLFNHENLQVSCYKDKKTCRFIKGFRKLICSISESKRILKGRLIKFIMIKIKAIERKAGFGKTSKTLWYPAIHLHSDVKFEEFIELVSDETTVSSADIKAVFDRAAKVLIRLLQDGKSIDCGDMGTYRPSITAKAGSGVDSADKVTVELVDKAKVIYTPRMKVKTALKGVRMERAERVLDVPYASSIKPNENNSGGSSSSDNNEHTGL